MVFVLLEAWVLAWVVHYSALFFYDLLEVLMEKHAAYTEASHSFDCV
jgi:hypothetical protein